MIAEVTALLRDAGLTLVEVDLGDDLMRVRSAAIVVSATGQAGILGRQHLGPQHRLVVDAGFTPDPGGPRSERPARRLRPPAAADPGAGRGRTDRDGRAARAPRP